MPCKGIKVTKNKTFEIQLDYFKDSGSWFDFELKWTKKQDHAGLYFTVTILGVYFHIWLCDNRHWDEEINNWQIYD